MEGYGYLWPVATIGGPIVLVLVIAYALLSRRRLTPSEKLDQTDAVRDLYRGGEGGDNAPQTTVRPKPERDG